jgi:methionyl-tRNA formyltransferase
MKNNYKNLKILMLCKEEKPHIQPLISFMKNMFKSNLNIYFGNINSKFPKDIINLEYDFLISYLSPWIIPEHILSKAKLGAINFHPGPPDYPGIGCFNFALYDNVASYGVTCHFMEKKVDTGKIIAVRRFKIYSQDTVSTLAEKSYTHMSTLFYDIIDKICSGEQINFDPNEQWKQRPRTRKELNSLCEINIDMKPEELSKRIRATVFPNMPGPKICLHNHIFNYSHSITSDL